EHTDTPSAQCDNAIEGALDLQPVALHDAVKHRHVQVQVLRQMVERAQIFGQTGTPKGEARFQVGRRNVEFRVAAKDVHHAMAIDGQRLAHVSNLVPEGDLERMPCVVDVLDHFGDFDGCLHERRLDADVEAADGVD